MYNVLEMYSLGSLNCRGLRDKTKGLALFNWLKTKYNGQTRYKIQMNWMKTSGKNRVTKYFFTWAVK